MDKKGKLILPTEIIAQITYLHSHCTTDEWSGILVYDVIEGDPSKPEKFVLKVKHIFLMDIGSAAHTEYEPDGDIVDIYDEIPEAMEMKLGHVHTHHSGNAYFSNVDMGELMDNVDKHNYYLSLVVNFDGNYTAKVVFLSDMHTVSKMNFTNDSGVLKHFKQNKVEKHMVVINMGIFYEGLGGFFSTRLDQVQKKIEEKKAKYKTNYQGFNGYGKNSNYFGNERHLPSGPINSKVIPDKMTRWEVEKLTKNLLMCDADLKAEGNVYGILNQIADTPEEKMDMFHGLLMNNTEPVVDAFFDAHLDPDEFELVMGEVMNSMARYEGLPKLADIVKSIGEVLGHVLINYGADDEQDEENGENKTIDEQLQKMENELP